MQVIDRYSNDLDFEKIFIVALLHDTIEDTEVEEGYISDKFGSDVEKYVSGVTKKKIVLKEKPTQEMLYQMNKELLEKVEKSGRISIIVKLEDRLNNLNTITPRPDKKEKYLRMIDETRNLYVPMATRNKLYLYKELFEEF